MSLLSDIALSRRPFVAMIAIGAVWGTFSAVIPPMKAQIGASDAAFGTLMLAASVGAVMAMWLAPLTQKLVGDFALILGCAVMASGFAIVSFAHGPLWYAGAMLLAAGGTGIADVLANAEISDAEAASGRSLMNLNHAIYSFSFAGSAALSGLAREAEWSNVQILTGVAIAVWLLCVVMLGRAVRNEDEEAESATTGMPLAIVLLGGGIALIAFLTESASEGWSALHLERAFAAEPAQSALGPALFGLMMGTGRIFGHWLARLVRDVSLIGIGLAVSASGFVLAGLAPAMWLSWLGFALAGLGISVVVPLAFAIVGRCVPPRHRLGAMSRAAAMGYAAFFVGPPGMGLLAQFFGLRFAMCVLATLLLGAALTLLPVLARRITPVGGRNDTAR